MTVEARFNTLFSAFNHLQLSAYDNTKLVVAVLSESEQNFSCHEIRLESSHGVLYYAVNWLGGWIVCGQINQYQVSLALCDNPSAVKVVSQIDVPVMSMQQVGFMCVESAHFDHC